MDRQCIGCGIKIQSEDKTALGYSPKEDGEYCQRCFRIRHYDDMMFSMKQGIDSASIIQKIQEKDALILWVVDIFDFESNIVTGINRHFINKNIVLVVTKQDLLPETFSEKKLLNFIYERMKFYGIQICGIVICGDLVHHVNADWNASIEALHDTIETCRNNQDVVVMGMANAGKSTLLNAYLNNFQTTTSRYPGTTLDLIPIQQKGYILYDTPGLTPQNSLLTLIDESKLKDIVPKSSVKARIFQVYQDQSFAIGGLVRLDIKTKNKVSVVFYFANSLSIHRGKLEHATQLWQKHKGDLLSPALETTCQSMSKYSHSPVHYKLDVVIHGLGWVCISGEFEEINVYVDKLVGVTFRKAMI